MTALLARGLLTYLLHSTLLLGAAALVRAALGERRLALQEAWVRAALVGGFVSAGLQVGLAVRPMAGEWRLPLAALESPVPASAAPASRAQDARSEPHTARVDSQAAARAGGAGTFAEEAADAAHAAETPRLPTGPNGPAWILAAWGGLALAALARLGVAAVRLRRLLRGRRPLWPDELPPGTASVAAALGLGAPVRWSAAERLPVPLAFGLVRREVCLPTRAIARLGADERLAVCAHELAHLARRDPAWILLARLVEAVAPFQPLNFWARRRLLALAECLSDDLAVGASGARLGLARSLVDVASWTVPGGPLLTAAGAVGARSRLGHRVERLMNAERPLERPCRSFLVAAAVVVAMAAVSPTVSGGGRRSAVEGAPAVAAQTAETPAPIVAAEPEAAADPAEREHARTAEQVKSAAVRDEAEATRRAAERDRAEAARKLEALGRQIQDRARSHEAEMRKLEAEIETLRGRIRPTTPEIEALNRALEGEIAARAEAFSDAEAAGHFGARDAAKLAAQLRQELDGPALAALGERARALAAIAAPTPEEAREMAKLAAELAHSARPDAAELDRAVREATRGALGAGSAVEQARWARDLARQAEAAAREALRRAEDDLRRLEAEEGKEPQPR
jgi:beta-lactamase regulating signal transducer with metallopeptidase domain